LPQDRAAAPPDPPPGGARAHRAGIAEASRRAIEPDPALSASPPRRVREGVRAVLPEGRIEVDTPPEDRIKGAAPPEGRIEGAAPSEEVAPHANGLPAPALTSSCCCSARLPLRWRLLRSWPPRLRPPAAAPALPVGCRYSSVPERGRCGGGRLREGGVRERRRHMVEGAVGEERASLRER
jgi:hypothetical protein